MDTRKTLIEEVPPIEELKAEKARLRRYRPTQADLLSRKQEWTNLITHTTSTTVTYDALKREIEYLRDYIKALEEQNEILRNGPKPIEEPEKPVKKFKPPLSVQDTFVG